jgi:two-component system chemotaxis response regulator CheB
MTRSRPEAVVVGASAGALDALSTILPRLDDDFPLPVIVVTHVPPDRENLLPELLASKCRLDVCEAMDKEPIRSGTIYFAPPDYHLLIETDKQLSLSSEELVNYSRPSIDVLFESAVQAYRAGLIGIILSGANNDGALGLKEIADNGGVAIVQRPNAAQVATMPQAALDACPTALALSLDEIATYLTEIPRS